jgi:hypothetical protein
MESFRLLCRVGAYLVPRYRFKRPTLAWWLDNDFTEFLQTFDELNGFNSERRWMMQQLVRLVTAVPGNTAECGAYKGAGSYLIARMNAVAPMARTHHVIDSFEGLSEPGTHDGLNWTRGDLASSENELRRNLEQFGASVVVHKGWIPAVFHSIEREPFAFVHVDVDLYAPTRESLEFFYPLLSPGAVFLCDDYGSTMCPGALKACDEFLADKPEKMIATAAGSGFFIKGTPTQQARSPLGRTSGSSFPDSPESKD